MIDDAQKVKTGDPIKRQEYENALNMTIQTSEGMLTSVTDRVAAQITLVATRLNLAASPTRNVWSMKFTESCEKFLSKDQCKF